MAALRWMGLVLALVFSVGLAQAADAIDDAFSRLEAARGEGKASTGGRQAAKPTGSANAIDAALSNLEAGRSHGGPAAPVSMDQAFEQAAAERQRRIVAAQRLQAATDYCNAAKAQQESCMASNCGTQPAAQVCTAQKRIEDNSPCNCSPKPCGCLRIPQYECAAYGPNPLRITWDACTASSAARCTASTPRITSIEQCVADRLQHENRVRKSDYYGFCASSLQVGKSKLKDEFSVGFHRVFTPVQGFSKEDIRGAASALKTVEHAFEKHLDAHTRFIGNKENYSTRNTLCQALFDSPAKAENERNKQIKKYRVSKFDQVFFVDWRYGGNKTSRLEHRE